MIRLSTATLGESRSLFGIFDGKRSSLKNVAKLFYRHTARI